MKKCKRKKAFIGSIIGMAGQIIGSAITANKERKAMEEQQQMQNKLDAVNQAAALSSAYNNQEYAEDFKKKVTMKAGGKYKKINNADRITREKQFKCGGRKKYYDGGFIPVTTTGVTVPAVTAPKQLSYFQPNTSSVQTATTNGSSVNMGSGGPDIVSGVTSAIGNIVSASMKPKQRIIQKATGFGFNNTDNVEQKDYQTDANGNVIQPQPQDNTNNTIQTNPVTKPQNAFAVDRPSSARLGAKKYKKRC